MSFPQPRGQIQQPWAGHPGATGFAVPPASQVLPPFQTTADRAGLQVLHGIVGHVSPDKFPPVRRLSFNPVGRVVVLGLHTYLPWVAIAVYTGNMNPQIIRDMLNRRPFEPFVLRLSSGDAYEIRHPEMALLLKNGVYIALPADNGDLPDRAVYCPFLHVAAAETLAVR